MGGTQAQLIVNKKKEEKLKCKLAMFIGNSYVIMKMFWFGGWKIGIKCKYCI